MSTDRFAFLDCVHLLGSDRAQAIADRILVDVSADAEQVGIREPVAITRTIETLLRWSVAPRARDQQLARLLGLAAAKWGKRRHQEANGRAACPTAWEESASCILSGAPRPVRIVRTRDEGLVIGVETDFFV